MVVQQKDQTKLTSKSVECRDCFQYMRPGPVSGFFTGNRVGVVFVFIAPTSISVRRGEGLDDLTRRSLKRIGLTSYGIVSAWRCMLEGSPKHAGNGESHLHPHCRRWLIDDLNTYRPLLIVSMGTAAMEALTFYPFNVYKNPGKIGIAERLEDFLLMPMMHPSNQEIPKRWMDEWNEGFDRLKEVLNGHSV